MKVSNRFKRNLSAGLSLLGIVCVISRGWMLWENPSSGRAWFEFVGMIVITYCAIDRYRQLAKLVRAGVLVLMLALSGHAYAQDSLRVMTYNIWDGFEHRPDRRAAFVDLIREQAPDVVMVQELVEFYGDSLAELGRQCGLPYTAILKEEWYPVGVMSRTPVEVLERRWSPYEEIFERREGLWHGFMHVRTADLDLLITHLSPFDYAYRLNESRQICAYADSAGLTDYLVAGDLNSYSPADSVRLVTLEKWREASLKADAKRAQWKNLNPEGMFDLTTQTNFLEHGLIDPVPQFVTDPAERVTHPTFYSRGKGPGDAGVAERQRRIDYILLSPSLAARCINAKIIKAEGISDHYPVLVTLTRKPR